MLSGSFVEAPAMSAVGQEETVTGPEKCVSGRPVYLWKLPTAGLAGRQVTGHSRWSLHD